MPFVVQIDAYDPGIAGAVSIYAASEDDSTVCHLNGQIWWPAIERLPTLALDFFGGEFGKIETPASSLTLSIEPWANFGRYSFPDARVRIWQGDPGAAWGAYTLRFDGRVTAAPVIENGRAQVNFAVDDRWLDQPLLATYAGTGGAEGRGEMQGTPKPLAIGAPQGVPGVVLDPVKWILQLSAYGAVESVDVPLERLARQFGAPAADYASYALLEAAAVPAGQWATCKAGGYVRMGAPPYGRLCFLMKGDKAGPDGWVRLPGAIIKRLADISGNLAKVSEASVDALDTARPYNLSLYYDTQISIRDAIQSIAASVNAAAGVSLTGQLFVVPIQINAAAQVLQADGSGLPAVAAVRGLGISAPWWRLEIGALPFWDVHSDSDYLHDGTTSTARYPSPPPTIWDFGSIWYDETGIGFRFEGDGLRINGEQILLAGEAIYGPNYTRVRDAGVENAQATADSKITTHRTETTPSATAIGDLWVKPSTGEMRRWDGANWVGPIVDLTSNAQVTTSPPADVVVNADYLGAIIAGQFNKVLTPIVLKGGLDARTDNATTYSVSDITSGLATFVSVNNTNGNANKGRVTITDTTATGSFVLHISYNGVEYGKHSILVKVVPADPPSGGGSGGAGGKSGSVDISGATFNGASFNEVGRISGLTKATGETIRCTLPSVVYQYIAAGSGSGTRHAIVRLQISAAGVNSWTNIGTDQAGTDSDWDGSAFYGNPGSVTCNRNATPSNGDFDVRVTIGQDTTGGTTTISSGTFGVTVGV